MNPKEQLHVGSASDHGRRGEPLGWSLFAPATPGGLIVEFAIEPKLCLHEARLSLVRGGCCMQVAAAYQSRSAAAWRHVAADNDDSCRPALVLDWIVTGGMATNDTYECRVTLRDACGALLTPASHRPNPAELHRAMGHAPDACDSGRLLIAFVPHPQNDDALRQGAGA